MEWARTFEPDANASYQPCHPTDPDCQRSGSGNVFVLPRNANAPQNDELPQHRQLSQDLPELYAPVASTSYACSYGSPVPALETFYPAQYDTYHSTGEATPLTSTSNAFDPTLTSFATPPHNLRLSNSVPPSWQNIFEQGTLPLDSPILWPSNTTQWQYPTATTVIENDSEKVCWNEPIYSQRVMGTDSSLYESWPHAVALDQPYNTEDYDPGRSHSPGSQDNRPSSPPITYPSDDVELLTVVLQTATDREKHDPSKVFDSRPPRAGPTTGTPSTPTRINKGFLSVTTSCKLCGDNIARLNFRSVTLLVGGAACQYICWQCVPNEEDSGATMQPASGRPTATYEDTISAAIDGLTMASSGVGGKLVRDDALPLPRSNSLPSSLKSSALTCDVCERIVGAGTAGMVGFEGAFTVEVVCQRCSATYAPCSDCGSGGGRLTPGRWRCIEMFPAQRKTCFLSHVRSPTLKELSFEILALKDASDRLKDYLSIKCRYLYYNTRMGALARPEMLEVGDGMVRTFEEVKKTTVDSWALLEPGIRQDIESTRAIRRYVAVQTTPLQSRRGVPRAGSTQKGLHERMVRGFLLVEHDLRRGSIFVPCVSPWATTGHAFEANTKLSDCSVLRVRQDLLATNEERRTRGLAPYPPLLTIWLVVPFQVENKLVTSLERRGYRDLEYTLRKYPHLDPHAFPPYRDIFIPKQYLKGYRFFVKVFQSDEDLGSLPDVLPTKKEIARSKK